MKCIADHALRQVADFKFLRYRSSLTRALPNVKSCKLIIIEHIEIYCLTYRVLFPATFACSRQALYGHYTEHYTDSYAQTNEIALSPLSRAQIFKRIAFIRAGDYTDSSLRFIRLHLHQRADKISLSVNSQSTQQHSRAVECRHLRLVVMQ